MVSKTSSALFLFYSKCILCKSICEVVILIAGMSLDLDETKADFLRCLCTEQAVCLRALFICLPLTERPLCNTFVIVIYMTFPLG